MSCFGARAYRDTAICKTTSTQEIDAMNTPSDNSGLEALMAEVGNENAKHVTAAIVYAAVRKPFSVG